MTKKKTKRQAGRARARRGHKTAAAASRQTTVQREDLPKFSPPAPGHCAAMRWGSVSTEPAGACGNDGDTSYGAAVLCAGHVRLLGDKRELLLWDWRVIYNRGGPEQVESAAKARLDATTAKERLDEARRAFSGPRTWPPAWVDEAVETAPAPRHSVVTPEYSAEDAAEDAAESARDAADDAFNELLAAHAGRFNTVPASGGGTPVRCSCHGLSVEELRAGVATATSPRLLAFDRWARETKPDMETYRRRWEELVAEEERLAHLDERPVTSKDEVHVRPADDATARTDEVAPTGNEAETARTEEKAQWARCVSVVDQVRDTGAIDRLSIPPWRCDLPGGHPGYHQAAGWTWGDDGTLVPPLPLPTLAEEEARRVRQDARRAAREERRRLRFLRRAPWWETMTGNLLVLMAGPLVKHWERYRCPGECEYDAEAVPEGTERIRCEQTTAHPGPHVATMGQGAWLVWEQDRTEDTDTDGGDAIEGAA